MADTERLFYEVGASWYWLLAGPAAALTMLGIEINSGLGAQWLVPVMFLIMVSGFLALQVKAARIHTSVELTRDTLRQGTETIDVADIVQVFPEPGPDPEKWQSGRVLGELSGVPRGRTAVGLKLSGGRMVQAWARRHRELRAALTELVRQRDAENRPPGTTP